MLLPPFELERFFVPYEFSCRHVACGSDMESLRLGELLAMADEESTELWQNLRFSYTESQGHPLLRREIANLYETVSPDGVLVTAGAEEAIFALTSVVCAAGGHAIVVWPAYQSLYEVPGGSGADVTLIELHHEEGWTLDPARVRSAIRPETKLIVINFPHNPTGATVSARTLVEIADIAREGGAWLLSDEVYRFSEHDPATRPPAGVDLGPHVISLGVMSKAFGLAGLRIGWLAIRDPALMAKVTEFKDYLSLCNSAPSELLALIALRAADRVLGRNLRIALSNLELLDRFIERYGDRIELVRPTAGCIGFPKLLGEPVEGFCRRLLESSGVLLMPGRVYGHSGNHFRIGFGRRDFTAALGALDLALEPAKA